MPIAFNCPSCQKKLTVKDEMAGKVAKCPCGTKLKIPSPKGSPAAQPAPAPAPAPQAPQAAAGSAFDSAFAGVPTNTPVGGQPMLGAQDPSLPMPGMPGQPMSGQQMPGQNPQVATPQAPVQQMQAPENLENINPEYKVQCIQCGQQYPMRPDLFGQTVACKCGAPIRFDDPLGTSGAMINNDPLGLGAAMESPAATGQPLAYQSVSQPQQSKRQSKAREDEVLKMYIKDEEEYEKATKPVKRSGGGGVAGAVAGLASGGGATPQLNFGMVFTGIAIIVGLIGLGVSMMIWPDAMGEYSWTNAEGFNEFLIIILWGFYTGIALCVIGAALGITACIIPGKIFYALHQATASHDDEE